MPSGAAAIETMCPKEGDVHKNATVVEVLPFGCLVEYAPGRQALCHISELAMERIEKVEDVANVGDKLDVKIIGVMDGGKKVRVSVRHLLPDFVPSSRDSRGPRRGGGGGGNNGRRRGGGGDYRGGGRERRG